MKRYCIQATLLCLLVPLNSCGKENSLEDELHEFLRPKMAGETYTVSSVEELRGGIYAARILIWKQNKLVRETGVLIHKKNGGFTDITDHFHKNVFANESEERTMLNRLGKLIAERFDVTKVTYNEGMQKHMSIDIENRDVFGTITTRFQIKGGENLQGMMYIEKFKYDPSGNWIFHDARLIEKPQ